MTARYQRFRFFGTVAALATAVGSVIMAVLRQRRRSTDPYAVPVLSAREERSLSDPAAPAAAWPRTDRSVVPAPALASPSSSPTRGQQRREPPEQRRAIPTGPDTELRPVDISPGLFRTGRVAMWAEAALLVGLGGWGVLGRALDAGGLPPVVAPLTATTAHSVGMVVFGALTLVATINRRATLILTGVAAVSLLLLFTIGITVSTDTVTGAWGFNYVSSGLHAVLMVTNLGLLMWIGGEALEGTPWKQMRRRRPPKPAARRRTPTPRPAHRRTTR